ncbi:unnamed protein product [marine sediment metagenome]|uniref:DUF559 domain-containing protein n=1 Tax=marine sediment metagenome TaxID=412755 RepID=X0RIE4_9ZZZZ
MGTTMSRITTKLRRGFVDKFLPIGEQLRAEGHTDYEIIKYYNGFVKAESIKLYRTKRGPQPIAIAIEATLKDGPDSKIEAIYYDLLLENQIPFEFQYKIGKFRADFLIDKWLVFEIDGPQHDKAKDTFRDKFMERLGYEILRVPAWLASASHGAVISEIKDLYEHGMK